MIIKDEKLLKLVRPVIKVMNEMTLKDLKKKLVR